MQKYYQKLLLQNLKNFPSIILPQQTADVKKGNVNDRDRLRCDTSKAFFTQKKMSFLRQQILKRLLIYEIIIF